MADDEGFLFVCLLPRATHPVRLNLRNYTPGDFEALYEIDQLCYEPEIAYSRPELREYLQFPGADCVVAEATALPAEGRSLQGLKPRGRHAVDVAALAATSKPPILGFCVTAHEEALGYIITIDVLAEHRRRGVGAALLKEVERRLAAQRVREIGLETATDNESAIAFWQKHGYRTRGVRRGYYPGGRDAYTMTKTIT